jgi:integrase
MVDTAPLLEPSFAEAITAIEAAHDLSEQQRRHWVCSLRQVAKWLDRPVRTIPARWTSIRLPVERLHHVPLGVTAKTVANHKANVRASLRWFGKRHDVPARGVPLSPDWAKLRDDIGDRGRRARLYALMRYCSGRGIAPNLVEGTVIDAHFRYRSETTNLAVNDAARRLVARSWNACIGQVEGWPTNRLFEPPVKAKEGPAWENFRLGLRKEIEAYLCGLQKVHRSANGKRFRPCSATTIRTRRAELVAVVRKAVAIGFPIESLTSLGALLAPDIVERVIDAYWRENGEEPKIFTIELGSKLLSIARTVGHLSEADIERLGDIRASLEDHRGPALTGKNLKLIRQVSTAGVWSEVVALPKLLMQEARPLTDHAPVKAAVMAQIAIAIAILTFAPIRLNNLDHIQIGENLIKPAGPDTPYRLVFERYDVKNRVDLDFPFDEDLTALIDEYIHDFRPALLRGFNASWLFPGEGGKSKTASMFSTQITERIQKATGLRITVHQFRHAAAAIYLRQNPVDYETVRRLLGHKNITTTTRFYCALETTEATRKFGAIVRNLLEFEPEDA